MKVSTIDIDVFNSFDEVIDLMFSKLNSGVSCSAIAINPEKVISAIESDTIRSIINDADIKYPDGIGIVKVIESKYNKKVPRIPGCELWEKLMIHSANNNIPVYLVGASEDVITKTSSKLTEQYGVNIVGNQNGFFKSESQVIENIKNSGAKVVTVAMGSPKQELFIKKCKDAGIKAVFMGVGGSYDVYIGHVKRAPRLFLKLKLEWFYRLCSQPLRFKRQLKLLTFLKLMLQGKL